MMRNLLALFLLAPLMGCPATGADPDWPAIERELDLTAADLDDLAQTAVALNKPDTAKALQAAAQATRQASEVLAKGGDATDAWGLLDASLDVLSGLAEKEQDSNLALGVAAAKIVVRRARAYLPERVD